MPTTPRPALEHPALSEIGLVDVFAALSDPTRLVIVQTLLRDEDGRACGTFPVTVSASTLSHHFKVLRVGGLIHQEERGTRRWTSLRRDELERRFPGLLRLVEKF